MNESETREGKAPYQIEPELLGKRPRRVEYTRGVRKGRILLWNLCAALLVFLLYRMTERVEEIKQFVYHGQVTMATVTDSRFIEDSDYPCLAVAFRFEAGKRSVTGRARMRCTASVVAGDRLRITYLTADPGRTRLGKVPPEYLQEQQRNGILGLCAAGLVCWFIVVGIESALARSSYLLRYGVPVVAQVTQRNLYQSSEEGGDVYQLIYQYTGHDGKPHPGSMFAPSSAWKEGDSFTLLRHPKDVFESKPYFQFTSVRICGARGAQVPVV